MATYNFSVYEVPSSYYTSEVGAVLGSDVLTITDTDTLLHAQNSVDPGADQVFSFGNEPSVSTYTIGFLDFTQVNGSGPSYEMYAMEVTFSDSTKKYYVMSKDTGFFPSINDNLAVTSYSSFTNTPYGDIGSAVCFVEGTLIATPSGERPIEQLKTGDYVQTVDDGVKPILWIGSRKIHQSTMLANPKLQPILIKPGLLNGHKRPLLVSPQHRMHLTIEGRKNKELLIRAKHLAEFAPELARVAHGKKSVTYYHFLLDQHELVFANGVMSESLMPGKMALQGLSRADRRELSEIFPELRICSPCAPERFNTLVRPLLSRHQAQRVDISKASMFFA